VVGYEGKRMEADYCRGRVAMISKLSEAEIVCLLNDAEECCPDSETVTSIWEMFDEKKVITKAQEVALRRMVR